MRRVLRENGLSIVLLSKPVDSPHDQTGSE